MFMKKIINMITVVLAAVLALAFTAFADDTKYSYGHFYYHDHDGYVSIAGYLGSEKDIEIPSSIAGKPVSEIESGAFNGCGSIERITVPDTVVMVHSNSFTGAGSLRKIICEAEISGITAPAGVDIVQPEATTPAVTTTATVQTFDSSGYHPPVPYTDPPQTYRDNTTVLTGILTEDTTQPVVLPEVSQDEDIGDFAYEEDFLPDEIETVITASANEPTASQTTSEKAVAVTTKETAARETTSAITTAVTVPENIVSVSVNDAGNLVGIDESGSETVLDTDKTYITEQQSDGSVKIVDEDGAEIVLSEETTAAEQTTQIEAESDASAPVTENGSFNIVPIIIIAGAAVVVAAVIAVIVLKRKGK